MPASLGSLNVSVVCECHFHLKWHEFPLSTSKHLSHLERLGKESLDLPSTGHCDLVILR